MIAVLCAPKRPVKRDLRKEGRLGHTDVGVGRNQVFFGPAHIGTALQKRRRQSGRHLGQVWLFVKAEAARDGPRVPAQQDADIVFRLFDRLLAG